MVYYINMKHNKYELRGEDHGTLDTKRTATDIAQEEYSHLPPESALFMATMDIQDEHASRQELHHKMERNDKIVLKNEIEDGINDYFVSTEHETGTEITVDAVEAAPVDIEVYQIPVVHKLGEIATRR